MRRGWVVRRIGVFGIMSLVLSGMGGNAGAQVPKGAPIKIGYIDSLSGVFAFSGTHGRQGAILAVEEINAKGGLLGRPIELLIRDDKSRPSDGAAAMRELVDNGVVIATGGISSPVMAAVSEVAREIKTPFLAKAGYAAFLTEGASHRYFLRIATSARVLGAAMSIEIAKTPYRRACTVGLDFAYGRDIIEVTLQALRARIPGAQVIEGCQFWPPFQATEFSAILTAIAARNPEVLIFSGVVGRGGNDFVKQAKAFGLPERVPLLVHSTLGLQENSWTLMKTDIAPNMLVGSDFPTPPIREEARRFDATHRKRWGEMADTNAHLAYVAVYTLAEAIKKVGRLDKEAIVDALEGQTVRYLTGVEGTIRPFDHQSTVGWFVGNMIWDETNRVAGMGNVRYVEGKDLLLSKEDIEKLKKR